MRIVIFVPDSKPPEDHYSNERTSRNSAGHATGRLGIRATCTYEILVTKVN